MDRAFAYIREQAGMFRWMPENPEELSAQIEEGYAQAMRGELIPGYEVKRVLKERRLRRQIA